MSQPSELDPSLPVAEIDSISRRPRKPRLWRWLMALLVFVGCSAVCWWSTRPSLTPLGVKEINGYDYLCFLVKNETIKGSQVSIYLQRGKMRTPASYIVVSRSDGWIGDQAEIGIPTHGAQVFSGGKSINIRMQITPPSGGFLDAVREWLRPVVPARYLYPRTVLTSEAFVP